jgi:hypothetical protein
MRDRRDPDLLLVEEMTAPPPLEDARRSLEYWQDRHRALPVYRRRDRREAVEMARRWEARVRAAQQARFDASPVGRVLGALGIRLYAWRFTFTKRGVGSLIWQAGEARRGRSRSRLAAGGSRRRGRLLRPARAADLAFALLCRASPRRS